MSAGIWVHSYSVTPPRRGQIFGNSRWLSSESDVMAHDHDVMVEAVNHIWLLFDTSLSDIYIVLCHLLMMSVCILWVHPYTVTPINLDQSLAILGSLSSWNDATMSWLRLKTTFDCFSHPYWTYIVLWHLWMMSVCILWMRPYSVTPPRRGQILAILGSLPSGNDAMTHGWGCKPHLIASHIHIGNI